MKINRSFVQISLTAIITSVAFLTYNAFTGDGFKMAFSASDLQNLTVSERITWEDATEMKNAYLDDDNRILVQYQEEGKNKTERLEGFVFNAADLDSIINNNRDNNGKPDKVVFYLGKYGEFSTGILGFGQRPILHIIAVGVQGNSLLIDHDRYGDLPSVYDKADPCPPRCKDFH